MIEATRRFIREGEEGKEGIPLSSITKRHFQLQIKTLQNAPRDASKLEQIIKAKERENERARHIEDTQRLVTEIEMLKFVLFLVNRKTVGAHEQLVMFLLLFCLSSCSSLSAFESHRYSFLIAYPILQGRNVHHR